MSNNDQQPLVSVLMTAYNRERFIAEAIESVLASTYTHFELIVCDDCSADRTVEIARSYAQKDPRVKVYVNEKRLGQFPNRNRSADFATGKYIKYHDSDDLMNPDGLAYCVAEMEKYPDAAMGLANRDTRGNPDTIYMKPEESMQRHFFNDGVLLVGPSAMIIRREHFEKMNRFDPRFGVPSDNFFNVRMAAFYPIILLGKPFFQYRRHEGQEINNFDDYMIYGYLYFKELLDTVPLPLHPSKIRYLYRKMEKRHAIGLLKYLEATRSLKKCRNVMKATRFSWFDLIRSLFQ